MDIPCTYTCIYIYIYIYIYIIETYLSCLEERLLEIEIPSKRYNNLTKDERDALYSLKDDPSIIIKDADKGSVVVV